MDVLSWSRLQFGDTAAFHILWPLMSIGLALYMFVMEVLWITTKDERYYRQLRFWTKPFVLTFAIGTASGLPLAFQFGTNWSQFAQAAGDFLGNILGFETTIAFALESAFLAILVFGWKKVHPLVHLLSTGMVLLGASISAFWIMAANSWMQTPLGVTYTNGKLIVTNYTQAIFNPDTVVSFTHMWFACVESTLFMMAGISAIKLLKKSPKETKTFFLSTFKFCIGILVVIAPLQLVVGDLSGQIVGRYQPEKLAAMELQWQTNAPGIGAPLRLVAIPNDATQHNSFEIAIPGALSLMETHEPTGQVAGLTSFPAEDRPSTVQAAITFYTFRLMVLIGLIMAALMLAGCWYWYQGTLSVDRIGKHPLFLWAWILSIPLGIVATESGWMVREIGRQPWIVYHIIRTADGVSTGLYSAEVATTTLAITLMYVVFSITFIYLVSKMIAKGPDLTSPLP